ncbi:MAG TPA: twin-arginine translocation signal domain-containing protein, partial [Anaerolineales bacterium]|nr:twin-arginine translocation signal domain-containing protein [Anaerolineales bacterium]
MNQNISRRDFLKIAGAGLGSMAFRPYKSIHLGTFAEPKRLPEFPKSEIIGRVVDMGIDLRSRPTNDQNQNTSIAKLDADTLVEWGREVVGNVLYGLSNQRYVETPQGYIYASVLQPTRNLPNGPINEIPAGQPG